MPRSCALFVPAFLAAVLAGCAPGKGDIERSIRDEMKTSLGVDIATVELNKQADGTYLGTATAANGDVYEVSTTPPSGRQTEWKAIPGQTAVERTVRQGLEQQLQTKVKSLTLTRQAAGVYDGSAELGDGTKMKVSTTMEGKNLSWKAEPVQ